jgi:hypothetical protein
MAKEGSTDVLAVVQTSHCDISALLKGGANFCSRTPLIPGIYGINTVQEQPSCRTVMYVRDVNGESLLGRFSWDDPVGTTRYIKTIRFV